MQYTFPRHTLTTKPLKIRLSFVIPILCMIFSFAFLGIKLSRTLTRDIQEVREYCNNLYFKGADFKNLNITQNALTKPNNSKLLLPSEVKGSHTFDHLNINDINIEKFPILTITLKDVIANNYIKCFYPLKTTSNESKYLYDILSFQE